MTGKIGTYEHLYRKGFFVFFSLFFFKSLAGDYCAKINSGLSLIQEHHYKAPELNDSFSRQLFMRWVKEMDPRREFITNSDLLAANQLIYSLDDYLNNSSCGFMPFVANNVHQYFERAIRINKIIAASNLDFNITDTLQMNFGKEDIAADSQALYQRNVKLIKYKVLDNFFAMHEKLPRDSFNKWSAVLLEKNTNKAIQKYETILHDTAMVNETLTNTFIKALYSLTDAHSEFYSKHEIDEWKPLNESVSQTFGLILEDDISGVIRVKEIIAGSQAALADFIHAGDIMLEIKLDSDTYDCDLHTKEFLMALMDTSSKMEMHIKIRNAAGEVKSGLIKKSVIPITESLASAFILSGTHQLGYLKVPSFSNNKVCKDRETKIAGYAAEIIGKMKQDKTEGLILDLRDNGGGDIVEALNLAGIFVDGPVCYQSTNSFYSYPKIRFAEEKLIHYKKPMIVLVDGGTASSSELFVSSMRDYNRAIIVGNTTFGKFSYQSYYPLEDGLRNLFFGMFGADEDREYCKITRGEFYNLKGYNLQARGIEPDVRLAIKPFYYKESDLDAHLVPDTVSVTAKYKAWKDLPIRKLSSLSYARIMNDSLGATNNLKNESSRAFTPLSYEYFARPSYPLASQNQIAESCDKRIGYTVKNITEENYKSLPSYCNHLVNENSIETLSNDPVLREAYQVLVDLIYYGSK